PTHAWLPTLPAPYNFQVSCVLGNRSSVRRRRFKYTPVGPLKGNTGEVASRFAICFPLGRPQNGPERPFVIIAFNSAATSNLLFILLVSSRTLPASSVQTSHHSCVLSGSPNACRNP